jgi:hypothetical protein
MSKRAAVKWLPLAQCDCTDEAAIAGREHTNKLRDAAPIRDLWRSLIFFRKPAPTPTLGSSPRAGIFGSCSNNAGGPRGEEGERLSLEASAARPAFEGVEVAVQLPSRRVERRRPPKLRLSRTEASTRIGMRAPRGSATASTCVEGFCAYPVRKNAYAAAAGPFANSRAPVSMNLRVSSAQCLPSSASLWK